jgi:hypothetical protein
MQSGGEAKYEWLLNNLRRKIEKERHLKDTLGEFESYLKKINTFMED